MGQNRENQAAAAWLERYTIERICPALGLSPRLERVQPPAHGRKSILLLVWPEGGAPMVVRRIREPRLARKLRRVHAVLAANELPTPRLLYDAHSFLHWWRHGCAVTAETLIEGSSAFDAPMNPDRLRALGATLARFHRVESPQWGEPGRPRGGTSYDGLIVQKAVHRLDEIQRFESNAGGLPDEERRRILAFIGEYAGRWNDAGPHVLCHGMLNPGNILFTPAGGVALIDWATMRYGPAGTDLAEVLQRFCENPETEAALRGAYFEALPAERRAQYEALEPLFRVHCLLTRWAARERGRDKKRKRGAKGKKIRILRDAIAEWIERR